MARIKRGAGARTTSDGNLVARNRATPASLYKLRKKVTEHQRKLIEGVGFGGLLNVGSGRLPATICKWLVDKFDPQTEEIVIPGRGRIKANAVAVHRVTGLPMGEAEVKYEVNGKAIHTINTTCKFENGRAPRVVSLRKSLEVNTEANDQYLRFWLMIAISSFLCGSTSLTISPKCYTALIDLTKVKHMNWCQFVVDTLKGSMSKINKKDSLLGCQYFLAILYLDSLELGNIEVHEVQPRIAAWNGKLISKVIKLDTNRNGSFGKLKLKEFEGIVTGGTSWLGDLQDIDNFISDRASATMPLEKKSKLSQAIRKACVGFTEVMGTLISDVDHSGEGQEDQGVRRPKRGRTNNNDQEVAVRDDSHHPVEQGVRRTTRQRTNTNNERAFIVDDDEDDSDYNVGEDEEDEFDESECEAAVRNDSHHPVEQRVRRTTRQRTNNSNERAFIVDGDEDDSDYNVGEDKEDEIDESESEDLPDDVGLELSEDDVSHEEVDPPDKIAVAEAAKNARTPAAQVSKEKLRGNMQKDVEDPEPLGVIHNEKTRRERLRLPHCTSNARKRSENARPSTAAFAEDNTARRQEDPIAPEVIVSQLSKEKLRGKMQKDVEDPEPLEVIHNEETGRERLRVPPPTSDAGKGPWDFVVPPIDIMSFIDIPPTQNSVPGTCLI